MSNCFDKMDNLEEIDKFLKRHTLSGLNQEERENTNDQLQVLNGICDLKTADSSGGPASRTLCSQCRFDPWSGNQIPHATVKVEALSCRS